MYDSDAWDFFAKGVKIEYDIPTSEIEKMLDRIMFRGDDNTIGGMVPLNRNDVKEIYKMAF